MPADTTPGQRAYEAYAAVLHDTVLLEPWRRLLWLDRTAWEAAAEAAIVAWWQAHEALPTERLPCDTGPLQKEPSDA